MKKKLIIFAIILVLLIAGVVFLVLQSFTSFTEKSSIERGDESETYYTAFKGNLLKYSRDGAIYMDYNGNLIWTYSYEMSNPTCDICGSYVIIYDKNGNQVVLLDTSGFLKSIKTSYSITDANVAKQGVVAILTQDTTTGNLQIYNSSGEILVSGQLHMENNGYPIAIDISNDATKLIVSQLDLNSGDIKTTIAFYDFGDSGQNVVDNQVAIYSFSNQVFPEVHYLDNGRAVAFGDSEVVIFESSGEKIDKEIFVDGEIKNVFYSGKYIGMIYTTTDEDGCYVNMLEVYSQSGWQRISQEVDSTYTDAFMIGNQEVCLSNGTDVEIYNLFGVKRFSYSFTTGIHEIMRGDTLWRYYFITDQSISSVVLE